MRRPRTGINMFAADSHASRSRTRTAFTMAEVLFAIVVLGIGLILLAAAFPVGIKQGEKTQDATNASLIAQHALDQITKVVATYARPTYGGSWAPTPLSAPVADYVGKPVTMGLLDGAMVSNDADTVHTPDLRMKLLYPNWPSGVHLNIAADPTLADGRPQDSSKLHTGGAPWLGLAIDNAPAGVSATFLNVWGFRFETVGTGIVWYENLQWAYPPDRRYYWYAFYRQMYEDPTGYPNPVLVPPPVWAPEQLTAVRDDHITRRTYRMWIVAAKVPSGASAILSPQQVSARSTFNTPEDYALQWYTGTSATNQWLGLAPVRVPFDDGQPHNLTYAAPWLQDSVANGYIATGIQNGKIRRGGIMLDAWGEVYQIEDVTTNAVRFDRPLTSPVVDLISFWFNPNAIAVFPTIVTKQADLP